jgi:branched-chain amino acid transport system ATP-binding protein
MKVVAAPPAAARAPDALLRVTGLRVAYGAVPALRGVDLAVGAGEAVALLGANGAGKSTLIRAVMGFLQPAAGEIAFAGRTLAGLPIERRAWLGLGLCPEGRRVFAGMTVEENLEVASAAGARARRRRLDAIYGVFPQLADKRRARGWTLSGGQQQMLAIGRALMGSPRLLLLDEPSLGLAPRVADEILTRVRDIVQAGTAVLLAEQNVAKALAVSDRAYVLQLGVIVGAGPAAALAASDDVRRAFLGSQATGC